MGNVVLVAYVLRGKAFCFGLFFSSLAAFAFLMSFMNYSADDAHARYRFIAEGLEKFPQLFWVIGALCLVFAINAFWRALSEKAAVEITDDSVVFPFLSPQEIKYSNFEFIRFRKVHNNFLLEFDLKNKDQFKIYPLRMVLRVINLQKSFIVPLSHLDRKPDEIWNMLQDRMKVPSVVDK